MRTPLLATSLCTLLIALGACGGNNGNNGKPQCSDGIDNDGDGLIDFPSDPGCTSAEDDSEDSPPSPQCSDGRDNDGDGKIDYPNDPGCFSPLQDDETDDCPDGPMCPQCGNLKDDDGNGLIDFPNDPGCSAASDTLEYTDNPVACGSNVHIMQLPFNGMATGTLSGASSLMSPQCGGSGPENVYELRITAPKVVVATTDDPSTTADTVLYLRPADCTNNATELTCNNDDPMATNPMASTITYSITTPGTYYLVVDTWDSTGGNYALNVKFLTGEGQACSGPDDCGPGLVCRIPTGGTMKVCAKHECSDGVDNDGDGKIDYPNDPGCATPDGDDETDDCYPTIGPMCPECSDGIDNDGDGKIDFGTGPNNDPTCTSAADTSEACVSTEGVTAITMAMTMGDTTNSHADITLTCGFELAPDNMYRLALPALSNLDIGLTEGNFNGFYMALFNSTCAGTALSCEDDFTGIHLTNTAAGTYYLDVESDETTDLGTYTLDLSGKVPNNASCENALFQAGVFTCNIGYACKGTMGSRTCQPAACSDGIDNDSDGKIDYPNDPGCTSPDDDDETNPTTAPVCADTMDNDSDGQTDWPNDYGCIAASGASEVFCIGEMDPTSKITQKVTTGTSLNASNDETPSCGFSAASDIALALQLPVAVASLQVDTIGSSFDTVLSMRDAQCTVASELACDDDSGGNLTSKLTLSNVPPGGYAVLVDGYDANSGAFTVNVLGTVAVGTACDATSLGSAANAILFTNGALKCPASCSAATHKCL